MAEAERGGEGGRGGGGRGGERGGAEANLTMTMAAMITTFAVVVNQ